MKKPDYLTGTLVSNSLKINQFKVNGNIERGDWMIRDGIDINLLVKKPGDGGGGLFQPLYGNSFLSLISNFEVIWDARKCLDKLTEMGCEVTIRMRSVNGGEVHVAAFSNETQKTYRAYTGNLDEVCSSVLIRVLEEL